MNATWGKRNVNELNEQLADALNALDRVIEERDQLWIDARDRYAQAALTGLLGARGEDGRTPFTTWQYSQMIEAAFELADIAMARRKQR